MIQKYLDVFVIIYLNDFLIFQHIWKALWTCAEDVEETWWISFVCQQEEELIWNTESKLSEVCCEIRQDHSELTKNKNSYDLIKIHKIKESTDFSEPDELLLMIYHMLFSHSRTLNTSYM